MGKEIVFNDYRLEKYIRNCLEKEKGAITEEDMERIEFMDFGQSIYEDISVLVYCKKLRKIKFDEGVIQKYDLKALKDLPDLRYVSLINPTRPELTTLYQFVHFTSLQILFFGDVELPDLNEYGEIENLHILNCTGKEFSCKKIAGLKELRFIRLASEVTDDKCLGRLPKLEKYTNQWNDQPDCFDNMN